MKAYLIKAPEGDGMPSPRYERTQGEAHKVAMEQPKHLWPELTVQCVEIQDNQAGMLAALNGHPIILNVQKQWGLGSRGGLVEEELGE